MAQYDTIIKDGTIVDGTGTSRFFGDIAIRDGVIERIGGGISADKARTVIEAGGKIVAPGVVDPHTHYDAQVHWDPYCTNSGWHGTTTVAVGNCGFGFMPCRQADRVQYMRMMENTEQVPLGAMQTALPWKWESFTEWMAYMRGAKKGINIAAYMPLNSLMIYVMGYEAAKTRGATAQERQIMRDMLNEAMDNGAIGFAFSHLLQFNSHKDCDGSPMPTDMMQVEDAYYLAEVLAERDQGVIQCLCELPVYVSNRHVAEELAKVSGRNVLHNVITAFDALPDYHVGILNWLDECDRKRLNIYSQALIGRVWNEFNTIDADTMWQATPPFDELSMARGADAKKALLANPEFRARARQVYDPMLMAGSGGAVETFILLEARSDAFKAYEGRLLADIAAERGAAPIDVMLDIIAASEDAMAEFRTTQAASHDIEKIHQAFSHKRVLPGTSDGGAHVKFFSGGQYATDNIMQLVREEGRMSLEEVHRKLSYLPARVLDLHRRGALLEGYAADLYIYDFEQLGYDQDKYAKVYDLPGGDWRRVVRAEGIALNMVNGDVIFENGICTGKTPGRMVSNGGADLEREIGNVTLIAAE